jgi:hypothetical protein
MSDDSTPHLLLTMLGASGTGKTTYLVGMYAEMSFGAKGFFLSADQDTHVRLTRQWDQMVGAGILPRGTDESTTYPFRFRYGTTPLLSLEWVDYRGGAVASTTDTPDAAGLLKRLERSDSLYLTIDGATLAGVLRSERKAELELRRSTSLYNNIVANVLDARRAENLIPPSIVLLVTKGDLLIDVLEGDSEERRQQVANWAVGRYPQFFGPDRDVAVCVVSLGELGYAPDARIDASLVDPIAVHKPIVFTLFSWYRRQAMLFESMSAALERQGQAEQAQLRAHQAARINRFLGRKKAAEINTELSRSIDGSRMFAEFAADCANRARILEGELIGIDYFAGEQPITVQ